MKRALRSGLALAIAFMLVSCSQDDKQPPPAASTPQGQQDLPNLQQLANNAKQTCCQTFAPMMVALGQQQAAQTGQPNTASTTGQPSGALAMPMPLQMPGSGGCQDAIMNFEMAFRTMDNGQYANNPQAQQWRQAQGAGAINCVGQQMAASGAPMGQSNMMQYYLAAMMIAKDLEKASPGTEQQTSALIANVNGTPLVVVKSQPTSTTATTPSSGTTSSTNPNPGTTTATSQTSGTTQLTNDQAPSDPNANPFPFGDMTEIMPFLPQTGSGT